MILTEYELKTKEGESAICLLVTGDDIWRVHHRLHICCWQARPMECVGSFCYQCEIHGFHHEGSHE